MKSLATKIVNALAATEATNQTVDDVKSTNLKIQGRRAKAIEKPTAAALAAGAEPVKTTSTSQQSYDKLIDHFAQLIATLTAEPKYIPNENELKVATLNTRHGGHSAGRKTVCEIPIRSNKPPIQTSKRT